MNKTDILWWLYQQDKNDPLAAPVDLGRCRYRLFEWRAYQCSRKIATQIGGFGFCTQHAKIIRARMDGAE